MVKFLPAKYYILRIPATKYQVEPVDFRINAYTAANLVKHIYYTLFFCHCQSYQRFWTTETQKIPTDALRLPFK